MSLAKPSTYRAIVRSAVFVTVPVLLVAIRTGDPADLRKIMESSPFAGITSVSGALAIAAAGLLISCPFYLIFNIRRLNLSIPWNQLCWLSIIFITSILFGLGMKTVVDQIQDSPLISVLFIVPALSGLMLLYSVTSGWIDLIKDCRRFGRLVFPGLITRTDIDVQFRSFRTRRYRLKYARQLRFQQPKLSGKWPRGRVPMVTANDPASTVLAQWDEELRIRD